jgi:5-hydroxyisourate hydrolase
MPGRITTHVLDTMRGTGAGGMTVSLSRLSPDPRDFPAVTLDKGGRAVLLEGDNLTRGVHQIIFDAGTYQQAQADPFLGQIPVRFQISDSTAHTHIPLILSAFGYTTYRGG